MPPSPIDIIDLSKRLKNEKLFVANERKEIEGMNRKVQLLSTGLLHQSWLTGQLRIAFEIFSRGSSSSPFSCPFTNSNFTNGGDITENVELVECHKHISPKHLHSYIELFSILREHPELVSLFLATYEKEKGINKCLSGGNNVSLGDVLQGILNIYGGIGGPFLGDGTLHLKLLSLLAGYQLVGADSPRRILRQGSSAFSTLYRLIAETIPSSRLFLIGALHQPITQLLSSQELLCLGNHVPPTSPITFDGSSTLSNNNNNANRDIASLDKTEQMAQLTKIFIESILDNIHAFPKGLAWLIKDIHTQLSINLSQKDVSVICTDLIWSLFICPGVTNPEPFGVTDAPVGSQARHTLSQVATILQALALHRWEGTDPRLAEYISYFNPDSLSSILDLVLNIEVVPSESITNCLSRRTILMPENIMNPLFLWLKECLFILEQNGKLTEIEIWPDLVKLISNVNENLINNHQNSSVNTANSSSSGSVSGSNQNLSNSSSPSHTNSFLSGRKSLLSKRGLTSPPPIGRTNRVSNEVKSVLVLVFPINQQIWEWVGMKTELEVISQMKSSSNKSNQNGSNPDGDGLDGEGEEEEREDRSNNIVLEKRTRFSLSNDESSMSNDNKVDCDWDFENHVFLRCDYREGKILKLPDNLEAVSEAASTHSASSSIELEDQNDNLSDMLSANVSGRETPNVSGRNTPQEEEDDDDNDEELIEENQQVNHQENEQNEIPMAVDENDARDIPNNNPPNVNPPNINNLSINGPHSTSAVNKQVRSEIEDKFCKFEIKKSILNAGDDSVSLVSDTWSTDVLASDSELGGENSNQHLLASRASVVQNGPSLDLAQATGDQNINSETMSEAWSVTCLATNDIERLHDFDTDDTSSVARSDDTGRCELEGAHFDTPRSSVSGVGNSYQQERQEQDLLLFEDVHNENRPVQENENSLLTAEPTLMEIQDDNIPMEIQSGASTSSSVSTSKDNRNRPTPLVPGVSAPLTSSQQLTLSSTPIAQAASSSNSVRSTTFPKTITFDKTAERGDRESWDEENGRTKRFFRNFKLPFRGRNRKGRGHDDRFDWERDKERFGSEDNNNRLPADSPMLLPVPKLRKSLSEDVNTSPSSSQGNNESSDEILAKYRRKPSLTDTLDGPLLSTKAEPSTSGNAGKSVPHSLPIIIRKDSLKISRAELIFDARKKLRNVLSNCDLQNNQISQILDGSPIDISLINLLNLEIAIAISRSDQVSAAQLQEASRTVKQLGTEGCRKLLRVLRDDYRRRSDFISYLMRAKQGLLSTIQYLERTTVRAKHEGDTYSHYLITECVRLWIEEATQEKLIEDFIKEFCSTTAIDEKIELLEAFLFSLVDLFVGNKEPTEWQLTKTENALEQNIVAKIYSFALYPNGDADIHRDLVLKDHISRLEVIITPSHKDLRIPKSQLGECPWPPAQRELRMLSAYKTPADKLRCVIRTSSLIVNLLSSSSEKVVAADDFVPVLVFVIIKTNPPALLSTIQYVSSFYGRKIAGEDLYWWTQFCSAVEFIKTMEYAE